MGLDTDEDRGEGEELSSLKIAQQALAVHLRSGRVSQNVAQALHNLGLMRCQMGQLDAGMRLLEKSRRVFEQSVPDPWDYRHAYGLAETGRVLFQNGYPFEALERLRAALEIRRVAFEDAPEHMEVRAATGSLVSCLMVCGMIEGWPPYLWMEFQANREGLSGVNLASEQDVDLYIDRYFERVDREMWNGQLFTVPASRALVPISALPAPRHGFARASFPDQGEAVPQAPL